MSGLDLFPRANVFLFAVGSGCAVEDRLVGDSGDVRSWDGHDSPQTSCVHVVKLCQVRGAKGESVDAIDEGAGDLCFVKSAVSRGERVWGGPICLCICKILWKRCLAG